MDSFSDEFSAPSTSASSSLDSFSPLTSPKAHKCEDQTAEDEAIKNKNRRKRKAVLKVGYKKKFKTEICKLWSQNGTCKYGEECAFAHGSEEMREKIHIASNYKSRKCVQYHENGFCLYGIRCHFVHSLREDAKKNPSLSEYSYGNDLENLEIWFNNEDRDCLCKRRINRTRLPCFSKLAFE